MAETFERLSEALTYLKLSGWKVSKAKFYEDKHLIREKEDMPILKKSVDAYAVANLRKMADLDSDPTISNKLREETRLTRERADKVAFENKILRGDYVLLSDVSQMLAGRAAYLKGSLEDFFHGMTPAIIRKAGGDTQLTPEVTDYCLERLAEIFDFYSKPIVFTPDTKFKSSVEE